MSFNPLQINLERRISDLSKNKGTLMDRAYNGEVGKIIFNQNEFRRNLLIEEGEYNFALYTAFKRKFLFIEEDSCHHVRKSNVEGLGIALVEYLVYLNEFQKFLEGINYIEHEGEILEEERLESSLEEARIGVLKLSKIYNEMVKEKRELQKKLKSPYINSEQIKKELKLNTLNNN